MKTNIIPSLKLTVILIILFAFAYTLIIHGIAYFSPGHGDGVTLKQHGKVVGFENVGQSFTADKYFWSRPSAANYNAAGSSGSNKGPTNPDFLKTVQARIDTFLVHNPDVKKSDIPVEMVTASGSGLDPDISVASAFVQIPRISKTRNIEKQKLKILVMQHIEKPFLGLFGPEKINVLKLNIALDNLK